MAAGPNKIVPKTDFMIDQERRKAEEEKRRLELTTTPRPEFNCSELQLGSFLAGGDPKNIIVAGFPKSGAMWVKSILDSILPYYYQLSEIQVVKK